MNICIIRHGETDWNKIQRLQGTEDVPLNDTGRAQATACGKALAAIPWHGVITSTLSRARETGQLILQELHQVERSEILIYPEFTERDFGSGSGLTLAEREKRFPGFVYEGEESKEASLHRMLTGLSRLAKEHPEENFIIVSHGAVIYYLLLELLGEWNETDRVNNAHLSLLIQAGDSFKVHFKNRSSAAIRPSDFPHVSLN